MARTMEWCRFNFSAWLSDPAVQAMTYDERGRYVGVIAMLYRCPKPGRATEEQVRRWSRYDARSWKRHREVFAEAFKIQADGTWVQARVVREWSHFRRVSQARELAAHTRYAREAFDAVDRLRLGHDTRSPEQRKALGNMEPTAAIAPKSTENHRSTQPPPRMASSRPSPPLPSREDTDAVTRPKRTGGMQSVGSVLVGIGGMIVAADPQQLPAPPRSDLAEAFDMERVRALVTHEDPGDQKSLFALAGWLWKTGTRDMGSVAAIVQDAMINRPRNWFAFYSKNGKVRLAIEAKVREVRIARAKLERQGGDARRASGG